MLDRLLFLTYEKGDFIN